MKTTVEIADPLFEQARRLASREQTTMRALIEEGLRDVIAQRQHAPKPFRLPDVSFGGDGLLPGVSLEDWPHIRSLLYEDHGG